MKKKKMRWMKSKVHEQYDIFKCHELFISPVFIIISQLHSRVLH